ncbi:MAG TPA: hypothetical protein VNA20_18245 [Frankiaceae bacterium]|nr:hypothetical protein [Frankiaceae bacterium]
MSFLRDLDEKYVPRLAEAVDRALRVLPRRSPPPAKRAPARPAGRRPAATAPLPVIVRLRRLDDRWASGGPLALLREVPQLGAVLLAALVLVSSITVFSRNRPESQAGPGAGPGQTEDEFGDGTLGPDIGEDVAAYERTNIERLGRLGTKYRDRQVVAVVQFKAYLTPEQVRDLIGPIQARRAFYRASALKLPNGIVRTTPVEDLVVDSRRAFREAARLRAKEARELAKVAATIENDPAQKTEHEKDARLAQREADVLRGRCACVFAIVVRAQLRLLLDALRIPELRVIDVSDPGAELDELTYSALLPEETTIVTGGNQS